MNETLKGLFDLDILEESTESDDIMDTNIDDEPITESSTDPAGPTIETEDLAKETGIPIPGGLKEDPSATKVPGTNPAIPGGDSEKPTATPVPGTNPSIPSSTNIDAKTYNEILDRLQKSYKEQVEIVEMMRAVRPVDMTVEQLQESYNDDIVSDALYEAYTNGPMFEAVDRSDKDKVKSISKEISSKISDKLPDNAKFVKPSRILRFLFEPGFYFLTLSNIQLVQSIIKARLWQIPGLVYAKNEGGIKTLLSTLNKELSEDLGDYKLLASEVNPGLIDLLKGSGIGNTYILIIDKKVPEELKKISSPSIVPKDSEIKEIKDKKNVKTESVELSMVEGEVIDASDIIV